MRQASLTVNCAYPTWEAQGGAGLRQKGQVACTPSVLHACGAGRHVSRRMPASLQSTDGEVHDLCMYVVGLGSVSTAERDGCRPILEPCLRRFVSPANMLAAL